MKVLCFDIGGTFIKVGVIENEHFIEKTVLKTDAALGQNTLILRLVHTTRELLKKHKLTGVAISTAGSVDVVEGVVTVAPESIKEFGGINYKEIFQENFSLPVFVDNDVNCFAYAEGISGAAKRLNNFITMTIGTGIGGAIVLRKEIWRGSYYNGAEFGRMFINDKTFESLASTSSLIRAARKEGLIVEDGIDIFKAYDAKDRVAVKIVKDFYRILAIGIANLFYAFDPEAVIIGGGISNRKTLSSEIRREMKKIMAPELFRNTVVVNAHHANDGGMLGAYYNFIKTFEQESENN